MAGVGVTFENLWSGPGVPFGGSLIMMAVDTVLYALIAYWLDAVMPSELLLIIFSAFVYLITRTVFLNM